MVTGKKFQHLFHPNMAALLMILNLIPLLPLVLVSVAAGWRWPEVVPQALSARAWSYVFMAGSGACQAVWLSIRIALAITLLNACLAIPAANALARYKFRGKGTIEALLFSPIIIPPFVAVMGMYMNFIRLGLTASITGVILAHVIPTLPYMIRALMVSFATLGFQWEEQARLLGAGQWQRFRYIILPHIMPGLVAGASLSILISLSQYLITLLVGEGQVMTLSLILFPFISSGDPAIGAVYTILFATIAAATLWGTDATLTRFYGKRIRVHV